MYTLTLEKVSLKNVSLVGGKAASLGELLRAKLPVPNGFVVPTKVYHQFNHQPLPQQLKQEIFSAFDDLGTKTVAVRSSTVSEDSHDSSWAGQLETYLNVSCSEILSKILLCWQSLNSDRAKSYAHQKNISPKDQSMAVIIQAMVDAQVSGVMFTANPVSNNKEEIVIEAVSGLGDSLVSGRRTPENIVLSKNNFQLLTKQHSKLLKPSEIADLVKIGVQIEKLFNYPQDIEWSIDHTNKLWILQSRPITTL